MIAEANTIVRLRSPMLTAALVGLALLVAAGAGACADFSRGDPVPGTGGMGGAGDGGAGDGVGGASFAADVHPLLMESCASCHQAGGEAGDTTLLLTDQAVADYPSAMALVNTADPSSSRLLTKASGRGHQGGNVFAAGSSGYAVILGWIEGGALP